MVIKWLGPSIPTVLGHWLLVIYKLIDLAAKLRQMLESTAAGGCQPTVLLTDKWLVLSQRTFSVVYLHGCLLYKNYQGITLILLALGVG